METIVFILLSGVAILLCWSGWKTRVGWLFLSGLVAATPSVLYSYQRMRERRKPTATAELRSETVDRHAVDHGQQRNPPAARTAVVRGRMPVADLRPVAPHRTPVTDRTRGAPCRRADPLGAEDTESLRSLSAEVRRAVQVYMEYRTAQRHEDARKQRVRVEQILERWAQATEVKTCASEKTGMPAARELPALRVKPHVDG